MAEVLVTFTEATRAQNGDLYYGRVIGRRAHDGLWEGWLEFMLAGSDETFLTPRETEQPNRDDLKYWAQGLSTTYLEGALERAINPEPATLVPEAPQVVSSEPLQPATSVHRTPGTSQPGIPRRVVLDPFMAYAEGEGLLRGQLRALSRDHLQHIVEAYGFNGTNERDWARTVSADVLVQRIVDRVRERYESTAPGTERGAEADRPSSTAEGPSA